MTSTLESFAIGHTIVFSRGLIDVLPDEASLATMLAQEMGSRRPGPPHRYDSTPSSIACCSTKRTRSSHFGFARTPEEEDAANAKANELLKNSPYKDQLATAKLFLRSAGRRAQKEIPNLISPHLGDRVPIDMTAAALPLRRRNRRLPLPRQPTRRHRRLRSLRLPLGGRIKMDPWSDKLEMLKAKPVGTVAEREKMPFEVTPFMLYLTREINTNSSQAMPNGPASAATKAAASDKAPEASAKKARRHTPPQAEAASPPQPGLAALLFLQPPAEPLPVQARALTCVT